MTLVYRSSKQQPLKPVHGLGPGSYNISTDNKDAILKNDINNQKKSCVFASSTDRDIFETKKYQKELEEKQKQKAKQIKKQPSDQNSDEEQNKPTQKQEQIASPSIHLTKPKNSTDCTHVFNSKVKRLFQQSGQASLQQQRAKQISMMEEFKKLLMKDMYKSKKGKLFKTKDKLEAQKSINGEDHQVFPSIPNWEASYGYRYDPESGKWVSNENPNLMKMLIEKDILKTNEKKNHSLGPGYYFHKNGKEENKQKKFQDKLKQNCSNKSSSLLDSIIYPNLKPQTPIHGTIQQNQNNMKMRIRLLGKSNINKAQQVLANSPKILTSQDPNLVGKDNKQILLMNQMYKKFGQYIPRDEKQSPSKFIEKLKESKVTEEIQRLSPKIKYTQSKITQNHQHFSTKSPRFQLKDNKQDKKENVDNTGKSDQDNVLDDKNHSTLQNSTLILKSHNCKQPYSLGQDRFKQNNMKQNLGPGTYYPHQNESIQNSKLSPCLNLTEKRFGHFKKKSDLPGPGEYNVSQKLLKKQNSLGDAFAHYKKMNNEGIRKNFKREDSMESLYQTWGRQMNYIAKLQSHVRPQQSQEIGNSKKFDQQSGKSLTQAKKQLEESLRQFKATSMNVQQQKQTKSFTNERIASTVDVSKITEANQNKSPSKIYPKIKKHLYEYKELQDDKKEEERGPGKYETRRQLIRKTFNVTYT